MTAEYVIARKGEGWTLAKFEGDAEPSAVYEVLEPFGKKASCTCPAFIHRRKICKHILMVQDFHNKQGDQQ